MVPVRIWGPAGERDLRLALDTGATITVVSAHSLVDAGNDPAGSSDRVTMTTPMCPRTALVVDEWTACEGTVAPMGETISGFLGQAVRLAIPEQTGMRFGTGPGSQVSIEVAGEGRIRVRVEGSESDWSTSRSFWSHTSPRQGISRMPLSGSLNREWRARCRSCREAAGLCDDLRLPPVLLVHLNHDVSTLSTRLCSELA